MKPTDFSFSEGRVTHWDFSELDVSRKPSEQADELKEDMAQVSYGAHLVLDIGWYPSFDANGSFRVVVVRDERWDSPIYSDVCDSWESLKQSVERAVRAANSAGPSGHVGS